MAFAEAALVEFIELSKERRAAAREAAGRAADQERLREDVARLEKDVLVRAKEIERLDELLADKSITIDGKEARIRRLEEMLARSEKLSRKRLERWRQSDRWGRGRAARVSELSDELHKLKRATGRA